MPWPTTPDELFDLIDREVERQNTEVAAVRDQVAAPCSKFAPYPA
jgi:hypothetical protein